MALGLAELKELISQAEPRLSQSPFVVLHTWQRNDRKLHLALTERLQRLSKKSRVWKTPEFLTALKNAEYGFEEARARSRGGADGIFLLDRTYQPKNEMMNKIFERYLDRPHSGAEEVAKALGVELTCLTAVRLVSHHMRLLGVLYRSDVEDWCVLVDYDDTKP